MTAWTVMDDYNPNLSINLKEIHVCYILERLALVIIKAWVFN